MKFDFGEVLGRTWKIGWNHKVLWLWQMLPGLFAMALTPLILIGNPVFADFMSAPWNRFVSEGWVMILFMVLIFLLSFPLMAVSIIAQVITTYGAVKVEQGAEKLSFRELFTESLPYFWRAFGLYFIFGGAWMVIWFVFMIFITFGLTITAGLAALCFMPMFMLFIPILIIGYSVLELAQAAIIVDDMGTLESISHSWKLFRANTLHVIILMVILYFALSMLSSIFIIPAMFPMMLFPLAMEMVGNASTVLALFFLIFFPLLMLFSYAFQGILMAFFQSAWAVAYIRLTTVHGGENTPILLEHESARVK